MKWRGQEMRLYHFTELRALIGDTGLDVIRPGNVDLRTVAAPGSIIADGLKPYKAGSYDHVLRSPLPSCVWLTSDPDMGLKSHMGNHFSKYSDFRVTVLIPSIDRRLAHWPRYFRNHGQCAWSEATALPEAARRVTATFYVYFGKISRITEVLRYRVFAEED